MRGAEWEADEWEGYEDEQSSGRDDGRSYRDKRQPKSRVGRRVHFGACVVIAFVVAAHCSLTKHRRRQSRGAPKERASPDRLLACQAHAYRNALEMALDNGYTPGTKDCPIRTPVLWKGGRDVLVYHASTDGTWHALPGLDGNPERMPRAWALDFFAGNENFHEYMHMGTSIPRALQHFAADEPADELVLHDMHDAHVLPSVTRTSSKRRDNLVAYGHGVRI